MLPWYSLASVQMANNLIKWWRTKFLNGYKQFSVIQNETNRLSDTEELLGGSCGGGGGGGNGNDGHNADASFGLCEAAIPTCSTPPATSPRISSPPTSTPSSPIVTEETPRHQHHQETPTNTTPPPPPDKHLNLEEFSCDVSMEGGIYRDGQERQEFSFTLYDFDGHGKITKDDIAGLVTTIYETLGSSVKVPHYGSKTIKVKLTVSPDQGKRMSATVIDHKTPPRSSKQQTTTTPPTTATAPTVTTIQEENRNNKKRHVRRQCRRHKQPKPLHVHTCCNSTTCKDNNNISTAPLLLDLSDADAEFSDNCDSRVSAADDDDDDDDADDDGITEDEGECSEDQLPKSCEKSKPRRYQKYSQRHHYNVNGNNMPISPVLCTKARRTKKRSSSLQRKELLEIIQANMDKNNHSFQTTSRKQCPNHIIADSSDLRPTKQKPTRVGAGDTPQFECLANIVNTENCYLELTNLHSSRRTDFPIDGNNGCRYDKLFGAVVCIPNGGKSAHMCARNNNLNCNNNQRHKQQLRTPASHDIGVQPFRYHLLETTHHNLTNKYLKTTTTTTTTTAASAAEKKKLHKTYEATTEYEQKNRKHVKKFVAGHSSSPHHLKHRNRQEDQARAMAQVVRWLEQEFSSSNCHMKKEKKKKAEKTVPPAGNNGDAGGGAASPSVSSSVERHEHHHVHEHIHHHYHHYQEAAPVPVVV